MEELLKNNKELREMKEELERITADPELREKYYYREKQLRDELSRIKDGYMKGIKEGIMEGKKAGLIEGRKEGIEENRKYNIPIDVDTIEKGYPILCA